MKRKLLRASLAFLLVGTVQATSAQNLYWTEGFTNNGTVTSDPGATSSVYTYNGDAGTWTFYGVWTTTGTGCDAPGVSGSSRHVRSTNSTSLGSGTATVEDDTAYIITPAVTHGVQSISFLRSRSQRYMSIWTSADAVPTTNNWVLQAIVPKWNNPACDDTTVVINDLNAKQVRIRFERGTNTDIDSIRVTSVTSLPVSFGAISGIETNGKVSVNWHILTEDNTANYIIERSVDARTFTTAGTLKATQAGRYSWLDVAPVKGSNFYRIKAVDKDGSSMYSSVVKVAVGGKSGEISISPNPVRGGQLNLQVADLERGNYTISLFNTVGQVVYNRTVQFNGGSTTFPIQLPGNVKNGVYNLQLRNGAAVISKKVVVE